MIVSLVVHPEKGVPQIAIRVPKLYHNLEKWVEIEVFSPHFVVHMWYTFRFRVPKLGNYFKLKYANLYQDNLARKLLKHSKTNSCEI